MTAPEKRFAISDGTTGVPPTTAASSGLPWSERVLTSTSSGVTVRRGYGWMIRCVVAAFIWGLLLLVPVMSHRGWPANHDSTAPVTRMAAILGQWKIGHWIPVWSTHEQFGHGSPMPALYHKTFSYLSAAVLGATGGHPKAALVAPVLLLMVVAFCGMAFCLRHALGGRYPWLWLVGSATFVASNYATMDWFVRGALAEFAAFALIPWLLGWCLLLVGEGRWHWWIGPLLALLALSHSGLGLFGLLPLGIALALALLRWRWSNARRWIVPAASSIGAATLLVLPFALPMLAMGRFSRIDLLVKHPGFQPRTNHIDWWRYFWDPGWTWDAEWTSLTVPLDTACLLLLPIYLVLLVPRWRNAGAVGADARQRNNGVAAAPGWTAAFLLGTIATMAWLQRPSAFWVYEVVPGAAYLQFAWRLISYITPVLVICACIGLGWLASLSAASGSGRQRGPALVAAGVLAAAMLGWTAYPKMWWNRLQDGWISPQAIASEAQQQGDHVALGEFLPLVDWPEPSNRELTAHVQQAKAFLTKPLPVDEEGAGRCSATPSSARQPPERRSDEWRVVCARAGFATLPVFLAPGMKVQMHNTDAANAGWVLATATRSCADPRLKLALPAGASEVRVVFPTWGRTVRTAFTRPVFDFRRDCAPGAGNHAAKPLPGR